jgi:hypothetical protein
MLLKGRIYYAYLYWRKPMTKTAKTRGRPSYLLEGRKVTVYLDRDSISTAELLGDGNVSDGIRRALAATKKRFEYVQKDVDTKN